ncbi:MAG: tetraacyldisaccharide 4'-kinase, partial [Pontibacter sp.]|nr:tetraacyldisaccharide 4'-kinase [Pontibacter sp.]
VATLSRGFKRRIKGFVLADAHATANSLGDEPFQYHLDFKDVDVVVCEDRVKGIEQMLSLLPELQVIVLDDAMQHRPVQPSLNMLITDYNRPFYKDHVMPAGRLREPRSGARRADVVIMSKCPPEMTTDEMEQVRGQVKRYTRPDAPVYFSTFVYGKPVPVGKTVPLPKQVLLLTGIANAEPLKQYLSAQGYTILKHLTFPDHHNYTSHDLEQVQQLLQQKAYAGTAVLTTRKDAVKLTDTGLRLLTEKLPVFYVPIEVKFLADGEVFDALVLEHVQRLV